MTGCDNVSEIYVYMEFVGQQHCILTLRTPFVVWRVWDQDKLVSGEVQKSVDVFWHSYGQAGSSNLLS